ncbi:MAG TPA: hypothetical protein VEV63_09475, partial [Streptosporangiaceae bacterium]|nr:hypothetical protein [Streptosporangiaceae bacterium]
MKVRHGVRLVRAGVAAVAAAVVAVGVGSGDVARSAVGAAPASGGTGALAGVAVVSPRLAWAVGSTGSGHPLIERWDGLSWRRVRVGGLRGQLFGVSAVSPRVGWAVGYTGQAPNSELLVLRWKGSTWTRVPGSRLGVQRGMLESVSAVSATDAWAVGLTGRNKTLILHWNGIRWRRMLIPRTARTGLLTDVAPGPGKYAWAVGYPGPLILRWNGAAWAQVRSPYADFLYGV